MAAAAAASVVARAPSIRRLTAQKAAVSAYIFSTTVLKYDETFLKVNVHHVKFLKYITIRICILTSTMEHELLMFLFLFESFFFPNVV